MNKYLLDTNIFIRLFRKDIRAVRLLENLRYDDSALSVFTLAEMLVGCNSDKQKTFTRKFLSRYLQLPITSEISIEAVEIIHNNPDHFGKEVARKSVDAFIAATAIVHHHTLITLNRRHFEKLKHPHFHCIILRESEKEWLVEK